MNLEILKQNLKGTQWSDVQEQDGEIWANYNGELHYTTDGGQITIFEGNTQCKIRPSKALLTQVFDMGPDQNGFVKSEIDYAPKGYRFNY